MMMAGEKTIRDVIAFPKTQTAYCPMSETPTEVAREQLEELRLKTDLPE